MTEEKDLRYPIGPFVCPDPLTTDQLQASILKIGLLPEKLSRAVNGLDEQQLNTPYRPGGWTVRQVVNHLADSHSNALLRFKWALTDEDAVIKPYKEAAWAELPDSKNIAIDAALQSIGGIHKRWVHLLHHLDGQQWQRGFFHPEKNRVIGLREAAASYAWHGEHHLAHVEGLKTRMGWR